MNQELMEQFVGEARELLESSANAFLALEKNPDDADTMNVLFRAVHTLKGTSGIFDVAPLTQVVHAAEDVLDRVREGDLGLSADDIDLFLDALDQVSAWVDDLESDQELPKDAASVSEQLVVKLRGLLHQDSEALQPTADAAAILLSIAASQAVCATPSTPDWLSGMLASVTDKDLHAWYSALLDPATDSCLTAVQYQPSEQCFFTGDDPISTSLHVPSLCYMGVQLRQDWPADEDFDPYHCNLILQMVSQADDDAIKHALRYVDSEVDVFQLTGVSIIQPKGEVGQDADYAVFIQDAGLFVEQKDWQGLKNAVATVMELTAPGTIQVSALQWLLLLLQAKDVDMANIQALLTTVQTGHWQPAQGSVLLASQAVDHVLNDAVSDEMSDEASEEEFDEHMGDVTTAIPRPDEADLACAISILSVQVESLSLPCASSMWAGRHASVAQVLKGLCGSHESLQQAVDQAEKEHGFRPLLNWVEALLGAWSGTVAVSLDVATAIAKQDMLQGDPSDEENDDKTAARKPSFLRVEQERIDQLMDLVGELVVAKNALPFLSEKAEREFGVKSLAREIKGQYEVVNRLAEEFQTIVMRIRMVSVSTVFQRFPRLVRDLSRRLNKKIELVIEGEETEADKNMVEALADPLIHLVRNSLDHGIEMPSERLAAGKTELGRITLRAIQQEDQVLIEVSDDGKGLDPEALKQKAYAKGLLDEASLENISDQDALQLILRAGFSMAQEVSDLSGRGVGMDVVNSMVKEVGGSISLSSKLGVGTTVRLSLPLSMAVTRVMMVAVDGQNFGIGIEQIVETVKVPIGEIHHVKNNQAIVLRDRLIPLRSLRHALNMHAEEEQNNDAEVSVLVVSTRQGLLGLVVDEFHAGLDIIQKPLDGVMAGFSLFSGTALLGDGSVLLILNLEALSCQ